MAGNMTGGNMTGNTTNGTNSTPSSGRRLLQTRAEDIAALCANNANCSFDKGMCGPSAAATAAAMSADPKLAPIMAAAMKCAIGASAPGAAITCSTDAKDKCVSNKATGQCSLPDNDIVDLMLDSMAPGPFKDMSKAVVKCELESNMTKCAAIKGCSKPASGDTCVQNPQAFMMDLMTAEVPGQAPRCASIADKMITSMGPAMLKCAPNTDAASCAAAAGCTWESEDDSGGDMSMCVPDQGVQFTAVAGEVDGANLLSMLNKCKAAGSAAACAAVKLEMDFFAVQNPTKKKVSTTVTLKGITNVDKASQVKMKAAIAASLGAGVSAADIVFKKVHFPVKAQMKLEGKTMDDVTKDKPAFEASFKKGMAADLNVAAGDITIKEIKAAPARRRGLLAAGVSVDFSVDNAADTTAATALAAKVSSAAASPTSNLAKETATTPAVAVAPTFELEVEMEVSTADSASVASALSADTTSAAMVTNLKAEGFTDVATIVVASPTVVQNTAPAAAASAAARAGRHTAGVVLAAVATALFMLF
eukprot:CAMPEP_0197576610 /NCGR_PEP_ID=MMETSP1326-20131121/1568_1 /TAXON_ID=1155430 /ORGANISM="Genus nov. species nov., Strain RCC2288" /LENGTH=533 /DNA_ID=CAMNT_0043139565 /DNA_START=189 /DNA_END=1790 /DNA_ORIENTATION=-